jgi:aspartyl-tRNA(Asn)/glutamyl-tRNA(Gln) amidotransferase subunit C
MLKVTKELIKELAEDIMIEISDEQAEKVFQTENKIVDEFLKVTKINVEGVAPMHYPFDVINNYLRDDEDEITISKEELMINAPKKDKDYVLIKKVVK